MDKIELLKKIGLNEKEAKVYLAILELGSATIKPIATRAGVKRTSIYYFIDHLVELGLISQIAIKGKMHYKALPPTRLVDLEQEQLQMTQNLLPEFMSVFNTAGGKPRINYYEGPEQMKNIVREEPRCQKEVLYIWPGVDIMEMIGGTKFMEEIDQGRMKRGVMIKVIRFKEKDVTFKTSAHGTKYMREMRFAPPNVHLTMGIGIYDTVKVGFFSSQKEGFGILIESEELTQAMRIFHQLLWEKSTPAKPGEG